MRDSQREQWERDPLRSSVQSNAWNRLIVIWSIAAPLIVALLVIQFAPDWNWKELTATMVLALWFRQRRGGCGLGVRTHQVPYTMSLVQNRRVESGGFRPFGRIFLAFPRLTVILTHLAAAILGAVAFAILFFWIRHHFSRDIAEMGCYVARQSYSAGKEDEAIFLLGQARAEDRSYYEPLNLLAGIYLHRGNQKLALETYKKALEVLDREGGDPDLPPRANAFDRDIIVKHIDDLQKGSVPPVK